jgi:hypothetical protein
MMRYFAGLLLAAVTLSAQPATSQIATSNDFIMLSNDYGGRTYIGLPLAGQQTPKDPLDSLEAATISGPEIGAMFAQLCLTKLFDRGAYEAALASSAKDFKTTTRSLPAFSSPKPLLGSYNVAPGQFAQEQSRYGFSSLWLGEGLASIANRQFLRYSGSLVISGPVNAKDFYVPQCNLAARVSGLTSAAALLDSVQTAAAGASTIKRVEKPKYGYGIWTLPTGDGRLARISVEANALHKPAQTVYLTVQLLPVGKTK